MCSIDKSKKNGYETQKSDNNYSSRVTEDYGQSRNYDNYRSPRRLNGDYNSSNNRYRSPRYLNGDYDSSNNQGGINGKILSMDDGIRQSKEYMSPRKNAQGYQSPNRRINSERRSEVEDRMYERSNPVRYLKL